MFSPTARRAKTSRTCGSAAIIEERLEQVLRLAKPCSVVESGQTSFTEPSAELLQSPKLKRIFLGVAGR